MKILIIQIARLGDTYMSWPALRSLRRKHPEARIEVLTREKYIPAIKGLEVVDKTITLPSRHFAEPLFDSKVDVRGAYDRVSHFVEGLKSEKYDWIINLTFSPLSSYLAHAVSSGQTRVSGYTRHRDGFVAIPDDMSAYFYAQVGVHRANRYHLCEIFGTLMGCDLLPEDWKPPLFGIAAQSEAEIAIHIGASETHKSVSPEKWINIISQYLKISQDRVVLIGAPHEVPIAEKILASVPGDRVKSLVGKTQVFDLFGVLSSVKVLVGPDSAPMHIAGLTGTACLNISFPGVNFWETGPRAQGSVVVRVSSDQDFTSDRIAHILHKMRLGERQDPSVISVIAGIPAYWALCSKEAEFQWNLIQAIYTGTPFPESSYKEFDDGIVKLRDTNLLMLDQLGRMSGSADAKMAASIVERAEEIIETIGRLVPNLAIVIRWYQTEKVRIGPDSQESILKRSIDIHTTLARICDLYFESFQKRQDQAEEAP